MSGSIEQRSQSEMGRQILFSGLFARPFWASPLRRFVHFDGQTHLHGYGLIRSSPSREPLHCGPVSLGELAQLVWI